MMDSGAMTKQFKVLQRLRGRSLDELRTRGQQAVSAYRDQMSGVHRLPTDDEFRRLLDPQPFALLPLDDASIKKLFYQNADEHFFRSILGDVAMSFTSACGDEAGKYLVAKADEIIEGRFDLLGRKGIFVGRNVDWHLEPTTGIRSPAKHWKEFDELDNSETGDKKFVWELNRHQHFFTLGTAYKVTGNEKYAEIFCDHFESWIAQNPPGIGVNWMSSLEVAFRAMSWIWALNLFRDSYELSLELFSRAMRSLYLHGRHIEKYLSKYYSPNTHLTGEALALYYLGTQLPFFDRSKTWLKKGETILLNEVERQFHPDGVYFEQSTWYHRYSVDIYLHFKTLRERSQPKTGDSLSDRLDERLEAALNVMMHFTRPDGSMPLIGDDDGGRMLPITNAVPDDHRGSLAAGAAIFKRGDMKFVAGEAIQELFWLQGYTECGRYNELQAERPDVLSASFPDGGYYVMRDGWLTTDDHIIIDCGEVGALSGAHGHADTLAFEMSLGGRQLMVDPGTYSYHESKDLRELFRSSGGHNTLTIDGRSSSQSDGVFTWAIRSRATAKRWITDDRFDFFEGSQDGFLQQSADIITQNSGDIGEHTRSFFYLKGGYIIIRDLIEMSGKHNIELNFHYSRETAVTVDVEGEFAGGKDHRLFVFGDDGRLVQKESWISKVHGAKINAPLIRFEAEGRGTQEFFTFILPADAGTEKPEAVEFPMTGGRAFLIKFRGSTDLITIGDGETKLRNEIFGSDFEWNWVRLDADSGTPAEIIAINGSKFSMSASRVFSSAENTDFLTAVRVGNQFNLKTERGRSVVAFVTR